jgi:WD40 repeat protein
MGIIFRKIDTSNNMYKLTSNHFLKVLVEHEQPITAIAISEDGKHVLTGDKDGQAIIWSFKDGINIE